jgi:hypothetical protein
MTELEEARALLGKAEEMAKRARWRLRRAWFVLVAGIVTLTLQTVLLIQARHVRNDAMLALARAVEVYKQAVDICQHPNAKPRAVYLPKYRGETHWDGGLKLKAGR